jgi:hypothetical protein
LPHLVIHQPGREAAACGKFGTGACFDHAPCVQHHDQIGGLKALSVDHEPLRFELNFLVGCREPRRQLETD